MNDWFTWKDESCTNYGIHVLEQPPITLPAERSTFTKVPGRAGTLTKLEGTDIYDDITLSPKCIISNTDQIASIGGYLKGSSKVTFANRQGGFYYARIVNQIEFEKILRGNPHCSFAVNFRCKPFFYLEDNPIITITQSATFITNNEAIASEPIITITGTGDITLMVGMYIVELEGIDGSIVINSELQEAYNDTTSLNNKMTGEFPLLQPGANAVSWDGNVTRITIQPNWRRL